MRANNSHTPYPCAHNRQKKQQLTKKNSETKKKGEHTTREREREREKIKKSNLTLLK